MSDAPSLDITWSDLAMQYCPGLTRDQAGWVLWNETCFPFGTVEQVTEDLRRFAEKEARNAD